MRNWVIACILPAVLLAAAPVGAAEEDIGGLIQALAADQEPARLKAIDALGALGAKGAEAVEALTKALSSDSPAMRAHAARALGKIGQPARGSVEALVRLVGDPEATVRREAARAIAAIRPGPKVTLPLLVKLLKDPDPAVKVRAMEAIAEHGEEAVAGLVQALADEKSAYWACLVLCELGAKAEPAVPGLIKLLDHAAPDVRQEAVLALAAVGEGAAPAAPRLVKALEDPLLQAPATYALVRIGKVPKEAQAKLRENAKGGDPMVKVVSMWALAKLRPRDKALVQEAVEAFVEGLKSDREQVRTAAARAISDIRPGPAVMVPLMEQALKGAEPETVRHALDALATLGAEAVPNLIQALKYEKARASVAYVLGEIGPKAAPATEALAGLLESSDPETRREAAVALAKAIGKEPSRVLKDVPAFIVNRLGYAMYREALALLEAGVADVETIDRSCRNALGLWAAMCGPFRWIDLTGGPALYAKAMAGVLPTLSNATELPQTLQDLAAADARGISNLRGFYQYNEDEVRQWENLLREHAWKVRDLMNQYFPLNPAGT